jgi:hypothetical protein
VNSYRGIGAVVCVGLALGGSAVAVATQIDTREPATGPQATTAGGGRGSVVSARHLLKVPREQVAADLTKAGFGNEGVRYGVDTYRLIYRTVDAQGRPTTASGLLALPRNDAQRLETVSYAHGTEVDRREAPSVRDEGWAVGPALSYASAGFAAVEPDYLGMGRGPGLHPYLDVPSETTASVDILRAARAFVRGTDRSLRRAVMVSGFSQGASAAMALARALQGGESNWFRLQAVAPISGPYDIEHAELPAMLSGELDPVMSVGYAAYVVVAWNRLHHLYDDPAEMFRAPFDRAVERLFDGRHTFEQLFAFLPDRLDQLFTTHGMELLRNPSGAMAAALAVSDATCADWAPRVPVRLYVSSGDREVALTNSQHCQASLISHGVVAPIIDLGPVDHLTSNILGTTATVGWFTRVSAGSGR